MTDLNFIFGFREKIEYFFSRAGQIVHKDVVFFLAQTETTDIKISHEHIEFAWLPFEEAAKQLTYENAKKILKKAEEFPGIMSTYRFFL